jgi:hypothetical protein
MLHSLALCIMALGQTAVEPRTESNRQDRLQYFRQLATELVLSGPDGARFDLKPEPVLRYSNAVRESGSSDGATFLWLNGKGPLAAVSFSIRRPDSHVYREVTSFSSAPLVCEQPSTPTWSPKTGGLVHQPFADAPTPASGRAQRLTQMGSLARRFSANCFHPRLDKSSELRLLTTPLYRFEDPQNGVLDGALYGFVVSTDPELFLLVEAVSDHRNGSSKWRYSLARMTSHKVTVRLDDFEIWSVPNFFRDPAEDRRTGPYTEIRLGRFMSEAGPPTPR